MTSENSGQTPIEAYFERLLQEAFERAATGAPGKTPDQVLELMQTHADRVKRMEISPEREDELKQTVKGLGLAPEDNPDPAIRRVNAKMAEWELDGSLSEEMRGVRYSNATPEDAAPPPDDDGNDPSEGTPPPPAPSGP